MSLDRLSAPPVRAQGKAQAGLRHLSSNMGAVMFDDGWVAAEKAAAAAAAVAAAAPPLAPASAEATAADAQGALAGADQEDEEGWVVVESPKPRRRRRKQEPRVAFGLRTDTHAAKSRLSSGGKSPPTVRSSGAAAPKAAGARLRKSFVMQLKSLADLPEYARRHDGSDPRWPLLREQLQRAGVHNYSIHVHRPSLLLFAYAEVEDEGSFGRVASSAPCKRWWRYFKDFGGQRYNADGTPWSADLEELFYMA